MSHSPPSKEVHTPTSSAVRVELPDGTSVRFRDEEYSDRIRCDHPEVGDGEALGAVLRAEASRRGRGRIVALVRTNTVAGLKSLGYRLEAVMRGFYAGRDDCFVLGDYPDPGRARLNGGLVTQFRRGRSPKARVSSRRATRDDAPQIAALIGEAFEHYPTPSDQPEYIAKLIDQGIPFRIVGEAADLAACASADLVPDARTAEITDCVTSPEHRGKGIMQSLILDLLGDLQSMDYPTAFTLARAIEPGMNKAFFNTGFLFRGTMPKSCRIGGGIEDINVWSRSTVALAGYPG
jgi:putative beta-lysine N-acetyltransferase